MKVAIIEDEELASTRLERMIHNFDKNIEIVAKLESVEESIEWFNNNPHPDLIFLDIHLEDGLSFTIFENVKITSSIVFTTAFDEYAIKAFKLKSVDYLLKPIVQEELNNSIKKYRNWNEENQNSNKNAKIESLLDLIENSGANYGPGKYKTRFSVQVGQRIKTYLIDDIAYFYSENGMTFFTTNTKNSYPIDLTLESLVEKLDPRYFFRVNRAFIVKLSSIANVHVFPKSRLKLDLTPAPNKEVLVSIDKTTKFKDWLDS